MHKKDMSAEYCKRRNQKNQNNIKKGHIETKQSIFLVNKQPEKCMDSHVRLLHATMTDVPPDSVLTLSSSSAFQMDDKELAALLT